MSKEINSSLLGSAADIVRSRETVIICDSSRLSGVDANRFRRTLAKRGIGALSVRSSLVRRAVIGTRHECLSQLIAGGLTLTFGDCDAVEHAKAIVDCAKSFEKLAVTGGSASGEMLDAKGVEALSKSPSRQELLSSIVAQLLSPGANLAACLMGPGSRLVGAVAAKGCSGDASE